MKQGKLKDARFHGLHVCKIPKEHMYKTFQRIMVENVKKGKKQQQQQQQQQNTSN